MKLTADTITDDQISQLWREATSAPLPHADPDIAHDCNTALGINLFDDVGRVQAIRAARARCAEILNQRAGKEAK